MFIHTLALTSEMAPYSNCNAILPIHFPEHVTLTLALPLDLTPLLTHSCAPCLLHFNPEFAFTREPDPNSKCNPFLPIHLAESLNLTLALDPGENSHHHLRCHPCLSVILKLNLAHALSSEMNSNVNHNCIIPLPVTKPLTLILALALDLTPHLPHQHRPHLILKLTFNFKFTLTSQPDSNSN